MSGFGFEGFAPVVTDGVARGAAEDEGGEAVGDP